MKILVTDVVADVSNQQAASAVGYGNHAGGSGSPQPIPRTDGRGNVVRGSSNTIRASGSTILFSDFHVEWFPATRLTQQVEGICYPPADQW
jgi:hypothetical protein